MPLPPIPQKKYSPGRDIRRNLEELLMTGNAGCAQVPEFAKH
jgi:hypothetical protein